MMEDVRDTSTAEESEARYRHLVENATDIIFTVDLTGKLLSVNAAGEQVFGYTRAETIGTSIFDLIAPAFRERVRAAIAHKLEHGGSTTYAIEVVTRDGRHVPLEVSTQIIHESGRAVAVQGIGRDITERRAAAAAVEQSEQYFRALIENATDAITVLNADGSIRYTSPAVERITGFTPAEREGVSVFETVHEDDRATAWQFFVRLMETPEQGVQAKLRVEHRDGTWRFVQFSSRNLLQDPAVRGIVVNWHDISEQVRADQLLKEREHFFRSVIEQSSDILLVVDAARTVRYVSPAYQAITGFTAEMLIGTEGVDLVHPDDRAKVADLYTALLQRNERTANVVLRARDADDVYHIFDVRVRNLLDNPAVNALIVDARDVTESMRVEDALRASEERFRKIVETSGEGISIRDPAGILTFINDRFGELLGYLPGELVGTDLHELIAPESRQTFRNGSARRRQTGRAEQADVELLRKDGRRVATLLSASPLFDADGNYTGSLGMWTDITERKHLEAQLRLSQKIEAVGRLAGGVAHDFNNLLTAIRGHVDLLLADIPTNSPLRGDIEEVRRAADRAASLTHQLLAFSRRQLLQPRVLDVDQVVAGIATLVRRLIGEDVRLETTLLSGGACVRADRGQLEQVIMNLAVNARDAMPRGGRLVIETSVVDIGEEFVRANPGARTGRYVQLLVRDTGIGMSSETLSHLFEPFYTTKEVGRGTGLGLATVYGIVKQSEGYIRVESEPEVGTTFEIMLPLVPGPAEIAPGAEPATEIAHGDETVLVVEDEAAVRALVCRILRQRGYHVLEARDGSEALEIARGHEPRIDLLLTDIVMPAMGGRELAEQLRKSRPELKVLFMSGYTDDALLQRGVEQGMGSFLEKPFTPDSLAAKVRDVLESD